MRDGDDFIARSDAERCQDEMDCSRAGIDCDAVAGANVGREFFFESLDLGAQHEGRVPKDATEDLGEIFFDFGMQGLQVCKRDLHYSSTFLSIRAGFPATTVLGGTSRVTTLPAPTTARSPMVTPQRIVLLVPMDAPRFTTVSTTCQSASV